MSLIMHQCEWNTNTMKTPVATRIMAEEVRRRERRLFSGEIGRNFDLGRDSPLRHRPYTKEEEGQTIYRRIRRIGGKGTVNLKGGGRQDNLRRTMRTAGGGASWTLTGV